MHTLGKTKYVNVPGHSKLSPKEQCPNQFLDSDGNLGAVSYSSYSMVTRAVRALSVWADTLSEADRIYLSNVVMGLIDGSRSPQPHFEEMKDNIIQSLQENNVSAVAAEIEIITDIFSAVSGNGILFNMSQIISLMLSDNVLVDNSVGDSGNDTLNGTQYADTILGNKGIDTIKGGAGDDWIFGGKGNDKIDGGSGNDTFIYRRGDEADEFLSGSTGGTLVLKNIDISTSRAVREGNNLIIKFDYRNEIPGTAGGDSIQIDDSYKFYRSQFEKIQFADNVVVELNNCEVR